MRAVGRTAAEDRLGGVAEEIAALAARAGRAQLVERGVRRERTRRRPAPRQPAPPKGLSRRSLRGERVETTHLGIARVGEQVALLVDQAPEDLVEQRPARRIGGAGGLASEVDKLPRARARPPRPGGAGGRDRRAGAASRHVTSAGGTPSCSSTRATACHASKVGPTSTVLIHG